MPSAQSSAPINLSRNASRPLAVRVILRSIWLNEIPIATEFPCQGGGFVDAEDALTTDGAHEIEMNITAAAVLRVTDLLPEAQRETINCWSLRRRAGTVTPRRRRRWASRSARS